MRTFPASLYQARAHRRWPRWRSPARSPGPCGRSRWRSTSRRSTQGPLLVTVDEEGKTRIKDVYTVSAPISGKLVRRRSRPATGSRRT